MPEVALAVWKELESPDCQIQKVADMISQDPMLSAKVINIANSPMFGGSAQTAVGPAILRLGTKETSRIVSTVSVMDSVRELPPPLAPSDFWMLGLGTALSGRKLAEELKYADPEEVYLAGLVHCLGDGVLAINFPDRVFESPPSPRPRPRENAHTGGSLCYRESGRASLGRSCQNRPFQWLLDNVYQRLLNIGKTDG